MTQISTPKASPPLEVIEPREEAVARAATESTAATAVTAIAEHALGSAPSVTVAKVRLATSDLPTRKRKPIEVARRDSIQVENPATTPKTELVYSAV